MDRAAITPVEFDGFARVLSDAESSKNRPLDDGDRAAILHVSGLVQSSGAARGEPRFERSDGSSGVVTRAADIVEEAPVAAGTPYLPHHHFDAEASLFERIA